MEPPSVISGMAYIDNPPEDPVELWSELLKAANQQFTTLNVATVDHEFGAMNRTVVYRGLTDGHISFATEKNSRKYANIMDNPNVSITVLLGSINFKGCESVWQIRLFGKAVELSPEQISNFWKEDPVCAKIRSRICECGKPVDYKKLKEAHDALLKAYEEGKDDLPQTETYTAFKIIPTAWVFWKNQGKRNFIADRVMYRKKDDAWLLEHIAA